MSSSTSSPRDADQHYYEVEESFTRHLPRPFRQRGIRFVSSGRRVEVLARVRGGDLAAHAAPLLQSVIPLLEFVDAELDLDLNDLFEQLRKGT